MTRNCFILSASRTERGDPGKAVDSGLTAWHASLTDALTSFGGTVAGTQAAAHAKLLALLTAQR